MDVLSADVQASLALNRVLLRALAAMSPSLNAAAERALEHEIEAARRQAAPQHLVDLIEDARDLMQDTPDDTEKLSALERALIAAADALPDVTELAVAEPASVARG